jgi:hypothetical protein
MASNLQVKNVLSATAQSVMDQNGKTSPLTVSTNVVGIGTAAPASKLHVVSAPSDPPPRLQSTPGGTGSFAAGWDFYSGGVGKGYVGVPDAGAGFGAGELLLFGGPGTTTSLWAGAGRTVTLDTNGNVGIGTAAPGAKLDVAGEVQIQTDSNPVHFTSVWRGWPSVAPNHAEISNETNLYKTLMIVGNSSAGMGRRVSVWDRLEVNGMLAVSGDVEVTGDIRLTNADCAEDFNIGTELSVEPGTVMVLGEDGALYPCQKAGDKRVVGVVSGAGDYKPGIVLDKQESTRNRQPIALLGKVFCKVDAQDGAIEVGDLLTTSSTQGHAMKCVDPAKASGAVIGKALHPLKEGLGLIPVLIALQ